MGESISNAFFEGPFTCEGSRFDRSGRQVFVYMVAHNWLVVIGPGVGFYPNAPLIVILVKPISADYG